jgi:hypothetical protein
MRPVAFQTAAKAADTGPSNGLTVVTYGAGYLLSGTRCDMLCNDVTAWYSASLAGPWRAVNTNRGRIATETAFPGQFVYCGHLSRTSAGLLATWCENGAASQPLVDYGDRFDVPVGLPTAAILAART